MSVNPTRRVLVTRAPHQASELADRLRFLGVEPILIPAIELVDPSSFAVLDRALERLATFDWVLFTSANAVEAFGARLALARAAVRLPSTLRVAAIGAATVRALDKLGLRADLVPPQAVAESLAEALLPHISQQAGCVTRFLLIRAEEARELLPDTLRQHGAEVTVAPAYRTVIPEASVDQIRAVFATTEPHPDAITFTSSSSARNLVALFEAAAVPFPETALRVSIGPITTQTLRDLGLPPYAEAPDATVPSLAETVMLALERPEGVRTES